MWQDPASDCRNACPKSIFQAPRHTAELSTARRGLDSSSFRSARHHWPPSPILLPKSFAIRPLRSTCSRSSDRADRPPGNVGRGALLRQRPRLKHSGNATAPAKGPTLRPFGRRRGEHRAGRCIPRYEFSPMRRLPKCDRHAGCSRMPPGSRHAVPGACVVTSRSSSRRTRVYARSVEVEGSAIQEPASN